MIKNFLIISFILITSSCDNRKKTSTLSDDYVLIEFAARLEEDYHKLYPQALDEQKDQKQK